MHEKYLQHLELTLFSGIATKLKRFLPIYIQLKKYPPKIKILNTLLKKNIIFSPESGKIND